jgi:CRISPR-associated protein Cmr1
MPRHQRLDMPIESFPRAELGLPIVFHFKDNQDPSESELCPVGHKRMASPIILRPIAFGDGRIGVPLIIRLRSETLNQVELKIKGKVVASFGPKSIRDPYVIG